MFFGLWIGFLGGIFFACENRPVNYGTPSMREITEDRLYHFSVLRVDGCEYLILELDKDAPHEGFGFLAHRGNCSNPIHVYDAEALEDYPPLEDSVLVGKRISLPKGP
ncbi:MAG: hypothetical protein OXB93_06960 [Cytophagales bacterium]|nr:hypothetical protein [Cytophagales bacterium]